MKKTQTIKYLLFLVSIIFGGCSEEISNDISDNKDLTPSLTIEKARDWYETNFLLSGNNGIFKAKNNDSTVITLKPLLNWDIAQLDNDSIWSVVELPWEYENGKVTMSIPEVKSYAENNKVDFKQTLRLVILKNRQTGETYGFKMVVIPELNYMLSKGGDVSSNDYFDRDANFSGLIIYYSIDDKFVNGWQYSKGKITGALKQTNPKANSKAQRAINIMDLVTVETCGLYYSEYAGTRYYGMDCYTTSYYSMTPIEFNTDYPFPGRYDTDNPGSSGGGVDTTPTTTPTECEGDECPICGGIVSWDFSDDTGQLNVKSTNPACPKCTCKRDYPKSKECLAYKEMYNDAIHDKHEYCALITTKGIHSWKAEDPDQGEWCGPFNPKWDATMKLWYIGSVNDKEYIVAQVHVHWNPDKDDFSVDGDTFVAVKLNGAPVFTLNTTGEIVGGVGNATGYNIIPIPSRFTVNSIMNCDNPQSLLNFCIK